ncbi:MAG TPA: TraC family protein [bacterium]|jgi:hypothetical protein|nr:TraC family protein [bacterium]
MATTRQLPSTQKYLHLSEIRDNTVVMDDGTVRSVLLVSSINFALKNEDEQNAIIGAYVNFLNNLSFPLQIVIQSRELNISDYLVDLQRREKEQTNELLKAQTADYIDYISELVSLGKIMNKRFYVVVTYNPLSDEKKGFMAIIKELFNPVSSIRMKEEKFRRLQKELSRRVDSVIAGLSSIGLNVVELDTQGVIELMYNSYNPDVSASQALDNVNNLRVK